MIAQSWNTIHFFQSCATKETLLKADKDYDYDVLLCFAFFRENKHNNRGNYCKLGDSFGSQNNIKEMRKLEKGKCDQFKRDLSRIHVHLSRLFSKDFLRFWQKHELNGHAIMCCVCVFVCDLRFSSLNAFGIVKFYGSTFFSFYL